MRNYDFRLLRVLVVDDSLFMTRVVSQMLKALGVGAIRECHSGNEAYFIAQEFQPDIIITDWDMDGGEGPDLVRRLRQDPESPCPFVHVIMLTGFAEKRRVLAARDFGITEFLTKPVAAKGLYARIIEIIDRPRAFVRVNDDYFGPDRRRAANQGYRGPERRDPDEEFADVG